MPKKTEVLISDMTQELSDAVTKLMDVCRTEGLTAKIEDGDFISGQVLVIGNMKAVFGRVAAGEKLPIASSLKETNDMLAHAGIETGGGESDEAAFLIPHALFSIFRAAGIDPKVIEGSKRTGTIGDLRQLLAFGKPVRH